MKTILDEIIANRKSEVLKQKREIPLSELMAKIGIHYLQNCCHLEAVVLSQNLKESLPQRG
jgi:predicted transporter